jgi:nucleoside-diphosphate-sugar epimerase
MNENPLKYGSSWNFGPDKTQLYSVESIIALLSKKLPSLKTVYIDNTLEETKFLMIDSANALEQLGWESLLTVKETIEWTVAWETQSQREHIRNFTKNQIFTYCQRVLEKI